MGVWCQLANPGPDKVLELLIKGTLYGLSSTCQDQLF